MNNNTEPSGRERRHEMASPGMAKVLPFRPRTTTDDTDDPCRTVPVSMSTTGREPYPTTATDVTDDQSAVIGSRTVGEVVPASRITDLRDQRRGTAVTVSKFAVSATNGWHLLGVEFETGHGPVDVAWQHEPTGAVMFDEVKTSGSARWAQPEWIYQIARYNLGGLEQFGDLFVGTRLLPLARMDIAQWFPQFHGPEGYKIAPTVSDPLRPATEASPDVETEGR